MNQYSILLFMVGVLVSASTFAAGAKDARKKNVADSVLVMKVIPTAADEIPPYSSAFPNSGMSQADPEGESRAKLALAGGAITLGGTVQADRVKDFLKENTRRLRKNQLIRKNLKAQVESLDHHIENLGQRSPYFALTKGEYADFQRSLERKANLQGLLKVHGEEKSILSQARRGKKVLRGLGVATALVGVGMVSYGLYGEDQQGARYISEHILKPMGSGGQVLEWIPEKINGKSQKAKK